MNKPNVLHPIKIVLLAALVVLTGHTPVHADARTAPAVSVAEAWLNQLDSSEYEQTWQEASAYFRSVVTTTQWQEAVTAARQPLGDMQVRVLSSATYSTTLPNAPEGEYVVIQYATTFSIESEIVETVAVMVDDETWKVTGYFVRKGTP